MMMSWVTSPDEVSVILFVKALRSLGKVSRLLMP